MLLQLVMLPGGSVEKQRVLGLATFARRDLGPGPRSYDVKVYKDAHVGGPSDVSELLGGRPPLAWRSGQVFGHVPGSRGQWDLIAAGLRTLLAARLAGYVGAVSPWDALRGAAADAIAADPREALALLGELLLEADRAVAREAEHDGGEALVMPDDTCDHCGAQSGRGQHDHECPVWASRGGRS